MFARMRTGPGTSRHSHNSIPLGPARAVPYSVEELESRRLLAVTLSLSGTQDIIPGTIINAAGTSRQTSYQQEMMVAVNPKNPLQVVAFGNTVATDGSFATRAELFRSTDGGNTWATPKTIDSTIDGLSDAVGRIDPSIAFDSNGIMYLAYGHGNDLLRVIKSSDAGATFPNQGVTVEVGGSSGLVDKWHLATGPRADGPGEAVYVAYMKANATTGLWEIWVAGSVDSGATWTKPTAPASDVAGAALFSPHPGVGPAGELYLSWHSNGSGKIYVDRDLDGLANGLSFGTDVVARTLVASAWRTLTKPPAQPSRGIYTAPTLAVDRSAGAHSGRLYLSFIDKASGAGTYDWDTFVTVSDDDGATWLNPNSGSAGALRVETPTSTEFNPWVTVDQTSGMVGVAYYSSQLDPGGTGDAAYDDVGYRIATSIDGGSTFAFDWLSSGVSNERDPSGSANDYLEYNGLALHGGTAHGFWSFRPSSTSTDLEAYTARASFNSATNANLLTVTGSNTNGAVLETIELRLSAANTNYLEVLVGGVRQYAGLLATIDQIVVDSQGGNDTVLLNFTNGNLLAGTSVSVVGGAGTDSIGVSADQNMTLTNSSVTIGSFGTATFSGIEGGALTGGNSANTIDASAASLSDTLFGGSGDDTLKGGTGPDILNGDTGTDTVTYAHRMSGNLTISIDNVANDGAASEGDNIWTTVEEVIGGSGNDSMSSSVSGSGGVTLRGGPGADTLTGGVGADNLFGDAGIDYINGDPTRTGSGGHDFIDGGDDGDFCFGGSGNDTLVGGTGTDNLWGDAGDDKFRAADNGTQDILHGGDGDDWAPFPGDSDSNRDSNDQKPDNDIEHW